MIDTHRESTLTVTDIIFSPILLPISAMARPVALLPLVWTTTSPEFNLTKLLRMAHAEVAAGNKAASSAGNYRKAISALPLYCTYIII